MNEKERSDKNTVCCPLCQSEEYLVSESGEKFICSKCGFYTEQLPNVEPTIQAKLKKCSQYIHACMNTLH